MLEVQKYLLNNTLDQLEVEFGIEVKEYDDRVVLNYNKIDSPKFHPIVRECRALILSYNDYKVLSRAFDRFFNLNEDPDEKKYDISKATLLEKIDGSIMPVYHDGVKWQVASRGTAFAEGTAQSGRTYREIFIEALGGDPNDVFYFLEKNLIVIFEMVSPETRVVKPYPEPKVYLIGIRNKETGKELPITVANDWPYDGLVRIPGVKWFYPKKYKFASYEDIFKSIKELPALDEGYVVNFENYENYRIKIKNPSYLAIAHMRMNGVPSDKRIAWLVWNNDYDEYISYFPEDQALFNPWIEARKKLVDDINANLHYMEIKNQKEFALTIQDCRCKSILFAIRKGNSLQKIFDKVSENTILNILENYKEKK